MLLNLQKLTGTVEDGSFSCDALRACRGTLHDRRWATIRTSKTSSHPSWIMKSRTANDLAQFALSTALHFGPFSPAASAPRVMPWQRLAPSLKSNSSLRLSRSSYRPISYFTHNFSGSHPNHQKKGCPRQSLCGCRGCIPDKDMSHIVPSRDSGRNHALPTTDAQCCCASAKSAP